MQRISNCSRIKNTILTPDKVLNSLVYGSPFCIIIYTSYKLSLSKMVRFSRIYWILAAKTQEAGLVQDKHSYNKNKQTCKRESVTEN